MALDETTTRYITKKEQSKGLKIAKRARNVSKLTRETCERETGNHTK